MKKDCRKKMPINKYNYWFDEDGAPRLISEYEPGDLWRAFCPECDDEFQLMFSDNEIPVHDNRRTNELCKGSNAQVNIKKPLASCGTVGDFIRELQKFDENMPLLITYEGWLRELQYCNWNSIKIDNLGNQNTSGDPEFYGRQECVLVKI